jgi:hypothetical protein
MNRFFQNAHAVPLIDLVTLNIVIIVAIVWAIKYFGYCEGNTCCYWLVGLLILSIIIHPLLGIPDNLSYYFGLGERPVGWRGA